MTEEYLFGDTDLAGRRLKVLADAFNPSSGVFLRGAGEREVRVAADLGCGPGYTTHLLGSALECERVVGLDNSEHFISLAEKTATARVSFRLHDVTTVPFPGAPCDVVYSRFLLTHQRDPETLIAGWTTQLPPRGRLLLEEVESIHTTNAAFEDYLAIVEAMLTDDGYCLYVGPKLDSMPAPEGLVKRSSSVIRLPVANRLAARMFSMNIRTWKHNAFARENHRAASIRKLERTLTGLAATPTEHTDIEWGLRQLVYEREK